MSMTACDAHGNQTIVVANTNHVNRGQVLSDHSLCIAGTAISMHTYGQQ